MKNILFLIVFLTLIITGCNKKSNDQENQVNSKKAGSKNNTKLPTKDNLSPLIKSLKLGDYNVSFKGFKALCDNKNGKACVLLAISYQKGLGVETNTDKYKWLLEEGCNLKNGFACNKLAYYYRWQKNDKEKAKTLFDKSNQLLNKECDKNDPESCLELALNYKFAFGVDKNLEKAVELTNKSYKLKGIYAPNSLGYLYKKEIGVKKDLSKANMLFTEGCENSDPTACFNMAYGYENAIGVDKDEEKSIKFYQKGCKAGSPGGCIKVGKHNQKSKKYESALEFFERSKSLGNTRAYSYIGKFYEEGLSVDKDEKKAIEIYDNGCEKDDGFSCFELAEKNVKLIKSEIGDLEELTSKGKKAINKAIKLLKTKCKKKDGESCYTLALSIARKTYVDGYWDKNTVNNFFEKGCKYNSAKSCVRAAFEKQVFETYSLYKKACKLDKSLCSHVKKYKNTVKKEFERYKKSCKPSYSMEPYSCLQVAKAHYNGYGTKMDRKEANKIYKLLFKEFKYRCKKGPGLVAMSKHLNFSLERQANNCKYLGQLYKYGKGIKRNKKESKKYYKKSIKIFETVCSDCLKNIDHCKKVGGKDSCNELSEIYNNGFGVPVNKKLGDKYHGNNCKINPMRCIPDQP